MSLLPARSLPFALLGLLGLMMFSAPTYAQKTATSLDSTENTAPSERAQNTLHVELLGAGMLYSVNYDRHVFGRWHLRGGYSALKGDFLFGGWVHLVPVQLTYVSDTEGALELGAGGTLLFGDTRTPVVATFTVGYRYQPRDQGHMYRVGFTPLVGYDDGFRAAPSIGFSWGYAF